jgi:hypothetical protein
MSSIDPGVTEPRERARFEHDTESDTGYFFLPKKTSQSDLHFADWDTDLVSFAFLDSNGRLVPESGRPDTSTTVLAAAAVALGAGFLVGRLLR